MTTDTNGAVDREALAAFVKRFEAGQEARQEAAAYLAGITVCFPAQEVAPPYVERWFKSFPAPDVSAQAEAAIEGAGMDALVALQRTAPLLSATVRDELLIVAQWQSAAWLQILRWAWAEQRLLYDKQVFYQVPEGTQPSPEVLQYLGATAYGFTAPDARTLPRSARPQGHSVPSIVHDGAIYPSSNLVLNGAVEGIHHRFPQPLVDGRPGYTYKTRAHTLRYLLDDPGSAANFDYAPVPDDVLATLLEHKSEFSPLDVDVLMAIDAQILQSGEGSAWVTARSILELRGIKPKRSSVGKRYSGGVRMVRIEDIAASVERLNCIFVKLATITSKTQRGRKQTYAHESKLLHIEERVTQLGLEGAGRQLEWLIRHGTWRAALPPELRESTACMMLAVLAYDPYHESWEKRIGQYLAMHLRIAAQNAEPLKLKIRTILESVNLPEGGIDGGTIKHPERKVKQPFERAITRLCEDGVIAACTYPNISLPSRGWLSRWADQTLTFTATASTTQQYAGITQRAQDNRNRAVIDADRRTERVKRLGAHGENGG